VGLGVLVEGFEEAGEVVEGAEDVRFEGPGEGNGVGRGLGGVWVFGLGRVVVVGRGNGGRVRTGAGEGDERDGEGTRGRVDRRGDCTEEEKVVEHPSLLLRWSGVRPVFAVDTAKVEFNVGTAEAMIEHYTRFATVLGACWSEVVAVAKHKVWSVGVWVGCISMERWWRR